MAQAGHNSFDAGHLKAFIERIEKLEEDRSALGEDIKEVYSEAKSSGYDSRIMRKVVALRRKDENKRQEEMTLLEIYCQALQMQLDL